MEMHPILPIAQLRAQVLQANSMFLWAGHPWVPWRVGVGAGAGAGVDVETERARAGRALGVNPRTYISRGSLSLFLPRLKEEYTPLQHPQSYRRISCNKLSS